MLPAGPTTRVTIPSVFRWFFKLPCISFQCMENAEQKFWRTWLMIYWQAFPFPCAFSRVRKSLHPFVFQVEKRSISGCVTQEMLFLLLSSSTFDRYKFVHERQLVNSVFREKIIRTSLLYNTPGPVDSPSTSMSLP